MASIAYDNSDKVYTPVQDSTTSDYTLSFTVGNHSNRFIFVQTSEYVSAVEFDGVSLSLLTFYNPSRSGSNDPYPIKVWGLANPTIGAKTLSVHNTSTGGAGAIGFYTLVSSYYNVDPIQSEAYNINTTSFGAGGGASSLSCDITTVTDTAWIILFGRGNNTGQTLGTSLTARQYTSDGGAGSSFSLSDSNAAKTPAGNYGATLSWSSGTGGIAGIFYSVKPYLTASFTGPSSGNVNAASTNFTVTPDVAINGSVTITPSGGGLSTPTVLNFSNSASPQTFTITPTTSGTITLTMTNAVGLNNSSPLTYTANAVVPTAPTVGTAIPLNTSATVAFTANSDGGSTITEYRAISTPGSFTGTGISSPITVSGLTNGTGYTFTVRATNAVGNSSESSASNSVTPYVPASSFTFTGPSSGNVRAESTNFTVTPNNTYNGTITITPSGVGSTGLSPEILTWNLSSAAQTFTITPIASGEITLTPTNSNGITNPANLTYTANAVVPLPPTIGLATPSLGSASVAFTAPTNDGGSSVTLYTVTSTPGGLTATTNTPGTVTILGLTNGTSYTFAVTATNSVGTSAPSSASNAVIPSATSTSFTNSGPKFNIEKNVGNILSF